MVLAVWYWWYGVGGVALVVWCWWRGAGGDDVGMAVVMVLAMMGPARSIWGHRALMHPKVRCQCLAASDPAMIPFS
eukprot:11213628-Lingulodinium_polyedra.AAC.1